MKLYKLLTHVIVVCNCKITVQIIVNKKTDQCDFQPICDFSKDDCTGITVCGWNPLAQQGICVLKGSAYAPCLTDDDCNPIHGSPGHCFTSQVDSAKDQLSFPLQYCSPRPDLHPQLHTGCHVDFVNSVVCHDNNNIDIECRHASNQPYPICVSGAQNVPLNPTTYKGYISAIDYVIIQEFDDALRSLGIMLGAGLVAPFFVPFIAIMPMIDISESVAEAADIIIDLGDTGHDTDDAINNDKTDKQTGDKIMIPNDLSLGQKIIENGLK